MISAVWRRSSALELPLNTWLRTPKACVEWQQRDEAETASLEDVVADHASDWHRRRTWSASGRLLHHICSDSAAPPNDKIYWKIGDPSRSVSVADDGTSSAAIACTKKHGAAPGLAERRDVASHESRPMRGQGDNARDPADEPIDARRFGSVCEPQVIKDRASLCPSIPAFSAALR